MADFSADKQALLKTLTNFDSDIRVEDVTGFPLICEQNGNVDVFFIHTLVETCCSFVEPDPGARKRMFLILEEFLIREKLVNPSIRFESLIDVRRKFARKFVRSLYKIRSSLHPSPKDFVSSPILLDSDCPNKKYPNTYEQNFEELKVIAEGGFGTVCMAVHKVDCHIYAVKKIIFDCEREKDFTKVMCEVKSISTLNHRNVVSYKNCWIQLLNNKGKKTGDGEEGSQSRNSVPRQSTGIKQKNKKQKCATFLSFTSDDSSSLWSCPTSSKVRNSCEDNLFDDKSKPTNLLHQVLNCNFDKTRASTPYGTNESSGSWVSSGHDQTSSELESDQSIVFCNSSQNISTCSSVSKCSNQNVVFKKTAASEDGTSSSEQEQSSESESDQSIVFLDSFRNDSERSLVSACDNLNIKSSVSSSASGGSWASTPVHSQTQELESDQSIIFCNSYTNDSVLKSVSARRNLDIKSGVSGNKNASVDCWSSCLENEQASELDQSIVFCDSPRNDSASAINSVLGNGGFKMSVSASHSKTSSATSRISNSAQDQMPSRSTTDDSIVIFDSTKNGSSESSWAFKIKFKAMLCIQMEYCDCDLRLWLDHRAKGDTLPFQKDVKDIFREIVSGVAHIHSKSIIHRDLKPQNIFYSVKDNFMKIGDFGLATLGHSSPNRQRVVYQHFTSNLGTCPYAAPEQMRKHNYDDKVDIYSLGIILIELLLPFQTHSEFFQTIPQIVKGDVPKELTSQWPCYVDLLKNLVQRNSKLRMSAKEILDLPVMEDDTEVDKRQLLREINYLKKAAEKKDKEFQDVLNEKDAIIEGLRLEAKQLLNVIRNLKSKRSRKKH